MEISSDILSFAFQGRFKSYAYFGFIDFLMCQIIPYTISF